MPCWHQPNVQGKQLRVGDNVNHRQMGHSLVPPVWGNQPITTKQTDCPRAQSKKGQDPAEGKRKKSHAGDMDTQELQDLCCIAIEIHLKSTASEGVWAKKPL